MIRITVAFSRECDPQVVVEGQITKASSVELANVCRECLSGTRHLALDLSGVSFADTAGLNLLRDLINRGCVLKECSEFVRALLGDHPSKDQKVAGEPSETELLSRLRAGNPDAFENVVLQYGGRMLSAARRFLNNQYDAEDAVQDAFVSAFGALETFSGDALLSTWLHRIVVNKALMQLRLKRRRGEVTIENLQPRFDEDGERTDDPSRWSDGSETILERRESLEIIRRCVEKLPLSYRAVLLLRDIEELDTEETALALGVTANAVKVRLHRGRQALKTLIEHELLLNPYQPKSRKVCH